jgi:dihydroneopterin aldolase
MGIIALEGMKFHARHGVQEYEREHGGYFEVDLYVELDYERAALSDNLYHTIDYTEYYRIIHDIMQQQYHLLEHINHLIIDAIHNKFKTVKWIKVRVKKLNPRIGGEVNWIAAIDQKEFE